MEQEALAMLLKSPAVTGKAQQVQGGSLCERPDPLSPPPPLCWTFS